jgi:predicted alpha/beta superfamily hydrolase
MKYELAILLGTFATLCGMGSDCRAEPTTEPSGGQPVVIPRAEQFDLRSQAGREYRIFVAGPRGTLPAAGAPVIYLSDGNANFPLVLAAAQRQIRDALPVIVVGIGYPTDDPVELRRHRSVDLTPPTSAEWTAANAKPFADLETGGNGRFLDFIEHELKPVIERKYPVDRSRQTLFGHSFGGLFVLHALFHRPEAFQTYVAVSPSLWWNDGSIRQEEQDFLKLQGDRPLAARVLLMVGAEEQPSTAPNQAPVRRGPPGRAVDSLKELSERLTAAKIAGLKAELRVFAEEHHGSVILPAASRGVRFALDEER